MKNYIQYKGDIYRLKHLTESGRQKRFKKVAYTPNNGYDYCKLDGKSYSRELALTLVREVDAKEFKKLKND